MYAASLGDSWSPPPHGALSQDGQARWMVDPNAEGNKTGGWVPLWMWSKNFEMLARIKLGIPAFSAQDRPEIIGPAAAQIEADSIVLGHVPLIVSDIRFVQDAGAFTGQTVAGRLETPPPPAPPAPLPQEVQTMDVIPTVLNVRLSDDQIRRLVTQTFAEYGIAASAAPIEPWVQQLRGDHSPEAVASFRDQVAAWAPQNGGSATPVAVAVVQPAAGIQAAPTAAPTTGGLPWGKLALAGAALWMFVKRGR